LGISDGIGFNPAKLFFENKMIKSAFNGGLGFLISLGLFFPTVWQPAKAAILMVCLSLACALLLNQLNRISRASIALSLIYATVGAVWSLYGIYIGNPGAHLVLTLMVAYPVILPILSFCYDEQDADRLHKMFLLLSVLITVFDLLFMASSLFMPGNYFSDYIFGLYKDDAVIDDAEEYFKFTIPNISTCVFLFPYLIVAFFHAKKHKLAIGVSILLMIVIVILSGRRALFVTPILGIIAAYVLTLGVKGPKSRFDVVKLSKFILLLVLLAIAALKFLDDFYGGGFYVEQIKSILDFSSNESNFERKLQFDALLDGFYESPLVGAGAGASASYLRSDTQPWAYELAYVAFAFQYGVFGFSVYAAGVVMLTLSLARAVRMHGRNSFEFFFLAGFITFMIANATNPYLAKFDYMWVIFIPFAILNKSLLRTKHISTNHGHVL
jgi:hypothetical protein